ncbi:iojap-related protein [Candidatus Moduliflexus flocculans]|uniref:Ribosomal silencing factor RsfS n=1 Tax=Candidatus Moduliflexus flocculans TaxID=1499966 RepID=A0A0S6W3T7_9BACT|nr:iojap-related protein [Candidatus Moduliflexus flocculans]
MTDTQSTRLTPQPLAAASREDAVAAAQAALDKKALNVVLLDVAGVVTYADYILVCSGRSSVQVKAIVSSIEDAMRARKIRPLHIEGGTEAHWVLMDYDDIIIHVFVEETRVFYNLERLWGDVPRTAFESPESALFSI